MKKIMSIIMVLLLAGTFAFAQQSGRERREAAEKKAAQERSRSMGGFRSGNEVKDDKGEVPKATNAAGQQKGDQQPAIDSEDSNQPTPEENLGSKGSNDGNSDTGNSTSANKGGNANGSNNNSGANTGSENAEKSNTPAVIQRTTSESGSPSVLSKDNGRGRDGTNSVQRATYNMAGAEVPANMNLSQKNRGERNINTGTNTKIRKQEEQPQKTLSKQTQRENKQQVNAQQRSDEQAKNKSDDKKKNKLQKKNRRNKDRDSG
ncbi:hypothetical protein KK083_28825 [Fulvivirgaceae bacterium PWU4]|uniref:Uncharacterized protein n=1 Tax=Chryseosolibacter histidini TaxID=2782349 RepID=A0AAP2DR28_9BACT|nr:hypothetical protein [Chryseosolibacter histidini]MBT1700931.1 hypothetical protein [Chryseosolibacter histidini]